MARQAALVCGLLLLIVGCSATAHRDVADAIEAASDMLARGRSLLAHQFEEYGRRQLLAGAAAPTSCNLVYTDTMRFCVANGAVMLAADAPAPTTDIDRLGAMMAAKKYTCEQQTVADCTASPGCMTQDVFNVSTSKNETKCTYPNDSPEVQAEVLCPGSWAAKANECRMAKACGPVAGSTTVCEQLPGSTQCTPEGLLDAFNVTKTGDPRALLNAIYNGSDDFYGCCPLGKVMGSTVNVIAKCATVMTESACVGACAWRSVHFRGKGVRANDGGANSGMCLPGVGALIGVVYGNESTLADYLAKADATCSAITKASPCTNSAPITIDQTKVTTYAAFTVAPGGGPCPSNASVNGTTVNGTLPDGTTVNGTANIGNGTNGTANATSKPAGNLAAHVAASGSTLVAGVAAASMLLWAMAA